MKKAWMAMVAVAILVAVGSPAVASVTLSDGNSVATFDLDSAAGLKSWVVDGVEHINQQWFWYRLGTSGGEYAVNTLDPANYFSRVTDSNGDGDNETLYVRYAGTGLQVEMTFLLTGGADSTHMSDMAETIRITNTSVAPIDFHFFQYVDFNLAGTAGDDTVVIEGGNTVRQSSGDTYVAETVVTPLPTHYTAGLATGLYSSLTDGSPTTWGDVTGPITGDVAWAFEWDRTIGAGRSLVISKDKNIVPEPATMVLMGAGLMMSMVLRRKR